MITGGKFCASRVQFSQVPKTFVNNQPELYPPLAMCPFQRGSRHWGLNFSNQKHTQLKNLSSRNIFSRSRKPGGVWSDCGGNQSGGDGGPQPRHSARRLLLLWILTLGTPGCTQLYDWVRWRLMSRRRESLSLARREGSRRATCVCIGASGTGSPPCRAPCVPSGSGRPLSGTTPAASGASQSTPGSLYQNNLFKGRQRLQCFSRPILTNALASYILQLNDCIKLYRKKLMFMSFASRMGGANEKPC